MGSGRGGVGGESVGGCQGAGESQRGGCSDDSSDVRAHAGARTSIFLMAGPPARPQQTESKPLRTRITHTLASLSFSLFLSLSLTLSGSKTTYIQLHTHITSLKLIDKLDRGKVFYFFVDLVMCLKKSDQPDQV